MRFFEEIADRESRNENEIVLYPEGLFYKAYDRSAFACVSRIPTFKPSKKRIKYCAREMASIGFPATALPKYFPAAPRPLPDGRVVIALKDRIDPDACQAWKSSLPLKERRPRGSSKAYAPILGRGAATGSLFVHPADLLPDGPAALAAAATGPKQPVRTTGGKGGVELPETSDAARGPEPGGPGHPQPAVCAAGEEGAVSGTDARPATEPPLSAGAGREPGQPGTVYGYGTLMPEPAVAMSEPAAAGNMRPRMYGEGDPLPAVRAASGQASEVPRRRPKWMVSLAYKMLGISDISRYGAPRPLSEEAWAGEPGAKPAAGNAVGPERAMPGMPVPNEPGTMMPGTAMEPGMPVPGSAPRELWPAGAAGETGAMQRPNPGAGEPNPEHAANPGTAADTARAPGWNPLPRTGPAARRMPGPNARNETREERAVRLIREFRLEAATPVECLLFVADLKKEIDGYL